MHISAPPRPRRDLEIRLFSALTAEHARAPDMSGVERDRRRRLTMPTLSRPALLAAPLADGRIASTHAWLHLPEHRVQLAAIDRDLWQTLKPLLAVAPYNPPRVRDIVTATGIGKETVADLARATSPRDEIGGGRKVAIHILEFFDRIG